MGLVAAVVPRLRFVFGYLTTAIHELGHCVFGWLFGYPSVPAFDFRYGGGVCYHQDRSILVLAGLYVLLAVAAWRARRSRPVLVALASLAVLHALAVWSGADEAVILSMGHGFELILAGVFLYRALSGSGVLKGIERPLYAFCGWFIVFCDLALAWGLATSPARRVLYQAAKGGGRWMDFSRLAEGHLHVELASVAWVFGLCCLAVPLLAGAAFRWRARLHAVLRPLVRSG